MTVTLPVAQMRFFSSALLGAPTLRADSAIMNDVGSIGQASVEHCRGEFRLDGFSPLRTSAILEGGKWEKGARNIALPARAEIPAEFFKGHVSFLTDRDAPAKTPANLTLVAGAALLAGGAIPVIADRLGDELLRGGRIPGFLLALEGVVKFLEANALAGQRDAATPRVILDWNPHRKSIAVFAISRRGRDETARLCLARGAAVLFGIKRTFPGFDGVESGLAVHPRQSLLIPGKDEHFERRFVTYQYGDGVMVEIGDYWKGSGVFPSPRGAFLAKLLAPRIFAKHWALRPGQDNRRTLEYLSHDVYTAEFLTGSNGMTEYPVMSRRVQRPKRAGDIYATHTVYIPVSLEEGQSAVTIRMEEKSAKGKGYDPRARGRSIVNQLDDLRRELRASTALAELPRIRPVVADLSAGKPARRGRMSEGELDKLRDALGSVGTLDEFARGFPGRSFAPKVPTKFRSANNPGTFTLGYRVPPNPLNIIVRVRTVDR